MSSLSLSLSLSLSTNETGLNDEDVSNETIQTFYFLNSTFWMLTSRDHSRLKN